MKKIIGFIIFTFLVVLGVSIGTAQSASVMVTTNIKQSLNLSITSVGKSYTITSSMLGKTFTWTNDISLKVKSNTGWVVKTELSDFLRLSTNASIYIPRADYQWKGGQQSAFIAWTRIRSLGTAQTVKSAVLGTAAAPTNGYSLPISLKLSVPSAQRTGRYTTTIIYTLTALF